jgi:cupin superfamily acireductone dioxygenase involved in methionine salvage
MRPVLIAAALFAANLASAQHLPRGTATDVTNADVVIIPPNTPHWFSEIVSDQIVYLVVRVDPHKILPAGYGANK